MDDADLKSALYKKIQRKSIVSGVMLIIFMLACPVFAFLIHPALCVAVLGFAIIFFIVDQSLADDKNELDRLYRS